MEILSTSALRSKLLTNADSPCVSIYLPVGASTESRAKAPQRLGRLVHLAEEMLARDFPGTVKTIIGPLRSIVEKFPNVTAGGLAIFHSKNVAALVPFSGRSGELAVVADSFHVKPLLTLLQSQERYYVVVLSSSSARVFEADAETIKEIDVFNAPYHVQQGTEEAKVFAPRTVSPEGGTRRLISFSTPENERRILRFYCEVDRRLRSRLRRHHEPLVLVASEQLEKLFRSVSRLKNFGGSASVNNWDDAKCSTELQAMTWPMVSDIFCKKRRQHSRYYRVMRLKGRVFEGLEDIARVAAAGKVETLLLERGVHIWGRVDRATGQVHLQRSQHEEATDDLLDDIAEMVLKSSGSVYVLETSEMPASAPAIAVLKRPTSLRSEGSEGSEGRR